jgi:hypothetical protein
VRDGAMRRLLKRAARSQWELGLWLQRAQRRRRGERPFELAGDCRRCARCCEQPGIQVGFLSFYLPTLRRLFLWWQRVVNGLVLVAHEPRQRVLLFRCTHFDPATRACDSYASRPGMCRDYPRLMLWQPSPEFLPGCGYRAIAPNAPGLRRALERVPLDTERRERLKRDLRLE